MCYNAAMDQKPSNPPLQFSLEIVLDWTAVVAAILYGLQASSPLAMLPLVAAAGWIIYRGLR